MEAIVSKAVEIPHESQILDHVMTQYRGKRSNGSNDEKLLKPELEITEEQWFNMIMPLDLRKYYSNCVVVKYYTFYFYFYFCYIAEMFMKEFIKNTMQTLQEKNHSEKVGITIGQINTVHSTKKVLTLRDYTGHYIFLYFKKSRVTIIIKNYVIIIISLKAKLRP